MNNHEEDHLPSVSPLIKKYREDKLKASSEKENSFGWELVET
jgi:hypothetical protein